MSYQPYPPEPDAQGYQAPPPYEALTERQPYPVYGASHTPYGEEANAQNQYQNYGGPAGNQGDRRTPYVDENARRANLRGRITSIIYFILGVLEVILLLRLLLRLLGANEASGFVVFIYNLSHIFVAPFNGIFNDQALGRSVFETSTLIAMIVYALLAWGIASLARLIFAPTNSART